MFTKKTVRDVSIKNQTVLLRTDYNVPLGQDGSIIDDLRIRASLPTIEYILAQKPNKLIIISHLG
ncbi:phosphoglycerate kinase, partial [Christensenellaceae bacterium OttesenSCG-928-L17]|nr:phosphoglycerate kinase [Christensenellaceae bacterium OttesenSCG-928-L17]